MIIRKLKEKEDFTSIEKGIAEYILTNGKDISKLSIRELAEMTFSSTSTITRLCHKLGVNGYSEFKILFNTEYQESIKYSKEYDENVPFQKKDSIQSIVGSIANINIRGIQESMELINYEKLNKAVQKLSECRGIHIFGQGSSLMSACEFKTKILRLGRQVYVEMDFASQMYQAAGADPNDVAIVISYSGENKEVLDIVRILKRKHISMIAITSEKDNTLKRAIPLSLSIGTSENKTLLGKLETFSSHSGTHFVLDCLYACLYKENYEENYKSSKTIETLIRKSR